MKISIITPTFNSSKTIERTLASVKNQTYLNIEHIVIDGLSCDDTIKIVNNFTHITQVVVEKDKGLYDAINKGIKLATGEVVGILNSDDVFFDDFVIEKIAHEFSTNLNLDSVIAPIVFYDFFTFKVKRVYSISKWQINFFKFGSMPPHPSFYCYRRLFSDFGYYDTNYTIAGDFDLMLRFLFVKRITFKKLDFYTNKMSLGGVSTKNLKSNFLLNKEIILSCRSNGVKSNIFFVYSKYLFKIFQLRFCYLFL